MPFSSSTFSPFSQSLMVYPLVFMPAFFFLAIRNYRQVQEQKGSSGMLILFQESSIRCYQYRPNLRALDLLMSIAKVFPTGALIFKNHLKMPFPDRFSSERIDSESMRVAMVIFVIKSLWRSSAPNTCLKSISSSVRGAR